MDLTERGQSTMRHPWEVQRFEAYRRILADNGALAALSVLDVGAGDAWFAERLATHLPDDAQITCWDSNYTADDLAVSAPGVTRSQSPPQPGFDLVLLLDVLEHIDEPAEFLGSELSSIASPGTPVLVSVPAYQWLFSAHDEALGHHRRYARRDLQSLLAEWLDVTTSGSLFISLIPPRAIAVGIERARPSHASQEEHGVGGWAGGRTLTTVANAVLASDAQMGRVAARFGVRLPGLSHWAFGVVR